MSNPLLAGDTWSGMALNAAEHKIGNSLKTFFFFFCSSVFVSVCVFPVWPKTTLFLPVWPRDAKGQMPLALTKGHGRLDLFPGESSSLKPNAAQSYKKMQYDVLQPVKKAHSVFLLCAKFVFSQCQERTKESNNFLCDLISKVSLVSFMFLRT